MTAQFEIPALEFVKRFQAGEIPATARVTVVYEGADTPSDPTLALIEEWLAGAPTDPAAIAEAEADLHEVQQALNATRESAGARILYPAMKSG